MIRLLRIKYRCVATMLALLTCSASAATTESTSEPTATTQSSAQKLPEAFAIFRTVNPFSSKKHPSTAESATQSVATGPESAIVLNGVAQCGTGCTAFFTGGKGSAILMLSVGDAVARGRVTAVDLDSVTYEAEGHSQRVEVGQNLNGQAPPASQPAAAGDQGKPDAPPAGPPDSQGPPGAPGGKTKRPHGPHPAPPQPSADQPSEQQDQTP